MITRLTIDHLDLFLELKENNPGQWKLGSDFDKTIDNERFFKERLCSENAYTIGCIENGKLLSITSLYEFTASAAWVWLYYCNTASNYLNFSKNQGLVLINEMFLEASRRKLPTCFILVREGFPSITSDAVGRMKDKIASWHDQVPELKKYYWVDEAKLKAGTKPKYQFLQWLIGDVCPVDLRLRMGIVKQEYRKEILFS